MAVGGARAPAAGLVAQAHGGGADTQGRGVAEHRRLKVALRLAPEEVEDAATQMRRLAGHQKNRPLGAGAQRDGAAATRRVSDRMGDAAERNDSAIGDPVRLGEPVELVSQPAGVTIEKSAGLIKRTTPRHGQNRRASGAGNPQGIVARAGMAADVDGDEPRLVAISKRSDAGVTDLRMKRGIGLANQLVSPMMAQVELEGISP